MHCGRRIKLNSLLFRIRRQCRSIANTSRAFIHAALCSSVVQSPSQSVGRSLFVCIGMLLQVSFTKTKNTSTVAFFGPPTILYPHSTATSQPANILSGWMMGRREQERDGDDGEMNTMRSNGGDGDMYKRKREEEDSRRSIECTEIRSNCTAFKCRIIFTRIKGGGETGRGFPWIDCAGGGGGGCCRRLTRFV